MTRDGSTIRELAHPDFSGAVNQSLAEARLGPGEETIAHLHRRSEELYRFVSGRGRMRLGDEGLEIGAGDTVVIPAGVPHKLWNLSTERDLVLLCCCAPAYQDSDTELLE